MSDSLIKVRYLPATNLKGARIKATHVESKKTLTISYNYSQNPMENKIHALKKLVEHNPTLFEPNKQWVYSQAKGIYYFVMITDYNNFNF